MNAFQFPLNYISGGSIKWEGEGTWEPQASAGICIDWRDRKQGLDKDFVWTCDLSASAYQYQPISLYQWNLVNCQPIMSTSCNEEPRCKGEDLCNVMYGVSGICDIENLPYASCFYCQEGDCIPGTFIIHAVDSQYCKTLQFPLPRQIAPYSLELESLKVKFAGKC